MKEYQTSLGFDTSYSSEPAALPELRDEVARVWGLPLGEQVEVNFRNGQLNALRGMLELISAPDYPWKAQQPLQLRIAGFAFNSREIESWTKL